MGYVKILKKIPMKGTPQGYAIFEHTDVGLFPTYGSRTRPMAYRRSRISPASCVTCPTGWTSITHRRAWTVETAEEIKQGALERLKRVDGRTFVRRSPSRCQSLRLNSMDGSCVHFPITTSRKHHISLSSAYSKFWSYFTGAVKCGEISHEITRGEIFVDTFARGVKTLYLETLVSACHCAIYFVVNTAHPLSGSWEIDQRR